MIRALSRRPLAMVCVGYLIIVGVIGAVAPMLLPEVATQRAGDLSRALQGPSAEHLLRFDALGRDVLERLLVGTRVTLIGVLEAVAVVLALGLPLGLAAGYRGGWLDTFVTWLGDLAFSVPAIVVIIVVLSVMPGSMLAGMVTLGVLMAPGLMRVVRSATASVRGEAYVAAAQVSGLSHHYIVARHVLPRIAGPVIVQTALLAAVALLVQTGLAFLGFLVEAPSPSWGGMVADGARTVVLQPWLIWPAGIAITITVLALGLLGDAVRDATTQSWAGVTPARGRQRRALPLPSEPPQTDTHTLLAVRDLEICLTAEHDVTPVVQGVSFDVHPGEILAVVGESGCGKTASVTAILGLLPQGLQLTKGRIDYDGLDLARLDERSLRAVRGRSIAFISQEPMVSLNPAFTVGWQLAEALQRHRGLSHRDARRAITELLSDVQFDHPEAVARRYPHQLSGGMAQRVAIARALAGDPRLLIADEPTTALDVTVQAEILGLLYALRTEREMAIVLVTHDWGVVTSVADTAVVMYAGQVVERAPVTSIVREPRHPYTEALLHADPHAAVRGRPLPAILGQVPRPGDWPRGCHFAPRCGYAENECSGASVPLSLLTPGREARCLLSDVVGSPT